MSDRQRVVLEVLGDGRLRLRGVRGQLIAPFNEEAAHAISRLFTEVVEFEHGLRPGRERPDTHHLEHLDVRLRRDILSSEQMLLLDELCAAHGSQLDIVVHGPPALLNLPLETLRHELQFLSYHNIALTRTPQSVHRTCSRSQLDEQDRLRVLLVPAQPVDQGPIQWEDTLFEMERNLWHFRRFAAIDWVETSSAHEFRTVERLRRLMDGQREPFDVVVFFAHGRCKPVPQIALVGPDGRAHWHSVEQLLPALTCGARLPRLVVLACCHLARMEENNPFSGFAYQLLQNGIPTVLSMQAAVSTRGAAIAVASVCRSLLQGKSISKVVLDCRQRMEREAILPALWLHPQCEQDQPLVKLTPTAPAALVEKARRGMASVLDSRTVEEHFAALRCLDDLDPVLLAREREVRDFFAERYFMDAVERLQAAQRAGSRETVAREILTLEERCPELTHGQEELREVRRWLLAPLTESLDAGLACERSRNWAEAAEHYRHVLEVETNGYHLERLWRDLRVKCSRHQRLVLAQLKLSQADTTWAEGNRDQSRELRQAGVRELEELLAAHPKEFSYLSGALTKQKQKARALELIARTEGLAEKGEWKALAETLETARKDCPEAVDAELLAAAREGQRLQPLIDAARKQAAKKKWAVACNLLEKDDRPLVAHPLLEAWWLNLGVEAEHEGWQAAAAADAGLERLLEGVCVPDAGPVWASGPTDPERIESLRKELYPAPLEELTRFMAERLGWDAPLLYAVHDDWPAARSALSILTGIDFNPAVYHQLVVAGLAQTLAAPREADNFPLWGTVLTHWATLAGCHDYWRDWLRSQGEDRNRMSAFLAKCRRQLAGWLQTRSAVARLLLECEQRQLLSPAEAGELVALGMEVSELALATENWPLLREVWLACLHLANRANNLRSTALRIYHTCTQYALPPRGEREPALLARRIELYQLMDQVLAGTPQASDARSELVGMLLVQGLANIDQSDFGDALLTAHACFEEAHNLQPSEVTAAGLVLGLGLLALEADPAQRSHLETAAEDILTRALRDWPGEHLLLLAGEWLRRRGNRTDERFRHFMATIARQGQLSRAGVVTADAAARAQLALEQGHHGDAVRFVLAALAEGPVDPTLPRRTFAAWSAPLFASQVGHKELPDLEQVRVQLRTALRHLPGDPELLELQGRLDEVARCVDGEELAERHGET